MVSVKVREEDAGVAFVEEKERFDCVWNGDLRVLDAIF